MKKYILTEDQLRILLRYKMKLKILEEVGVDNWVGNDYVMEYLEDDFPHAEDLSEIITEMVDEYIQTYEVKND